MCANKRLLQIPVGFSFPFILIPFDDFAASENPTLLEMSCSICSCETLFGQLPVLLINPPLFPLLAALELLTLPSFRVWLSLLGSVYSLFNYVDDFQILLFQIFFHLSYGSMYLSFDSLSWILCYNCCNYTQRWTHGLSYLISTSSSVYLALKLRSYI